MKTVKKNQEHLRNVIKAALFSALIFAVTYFIKLPVLVGYIHPGDALVFLAASVLPMPYAIASCALGGALSDLIGGYPVWIIATVIIKGLTAACFSAKTTKMICVRNLIALIPSLVLCAGGYYIFEALFISNSFIVPLAAVLPNVVQTAVGSAIYVLVGVVVDNSRPLRKLLY